MSSRNERPLEHLGALLNQSHSNAKTVNMPQCSFKNCKNHTSRTLKKDGISYFRFPRDPVRCGEWISVIARQRAEEFFKPTQGSVVCSKHFLESDEYVTTKGIRRLHKTAIPRITMGKNLGRLLN